MKALKGMLDRVTSPRNPSKWDYMAPQDNIYDPTVFEQFFRVPYLFIKNTPELVGSIFSFVFINIVFFLVYGGILN